MSRSLFFIVIFMAASARAFAEGTTVFPVPVEAQASLLSAANGAGCGCAFKESKLECTTCDSPGCVDKLSAFVKQDLRLPPDGGKFFAQAGLTSAMLADLNLGTCRGEKLQAWVQEREGLKTPRATAPKDVLDCWSYLAGRLERLAQPPTNDCAVLRAPEYEGLRLAARPCCATQMTPKEEAACVAPPLEKVATAMHQLRAQIGGLARKWATPSVVGYACRAQSAIHAAASGAMAQLDRDFGEKFYAQAMKGWAAARATPTDQPLGGADGVLARMPESPDLRGVMSREAAEANGAAEAKTLACAGADCAKEAADSDRVVDQIDACVVRKLRATAQDCPNCLVQVDAGCDKLASLMTVIHGEGGIAASFLGEASLRAGRVNQGEATAYKYRRSRIRNYFGHLREEFVTDLMRAQRSALREKGLPLAANSSCAKYPEIRKVVQGDDATAPADLSDEETLNVIHHAAEIKSGLLLHQTYRMQLSFRGRPHEGGACPVGQPYPRWRELGDQGGINCSRPEDQARLKQADDELAGLLRVSFDPHLKAGMAERALTSEGNLDLEMFPMVAKVTGLLALGDDPLAQYRDKFQFLNPNGRAKSPELQAVKKLLQNEGRALMREDLRKGLQVVCDDASWRHLLERSAVVARVKEQGCANDGLFPLIDGCAREAVAAEKAERGYIKGAAAALCAIGFVVPVTTGPTLIACGAEAGGMSYQAAAQASDEKDLAVASASLGPDGFDQAMEKLNKLSDAKDEIRVQVAMAILQAAGPAFKGGRALSLRARNLKGFDRLSAADQAGAERVVQALEQISREPDAARRATRAGETAQQLVALSDVGWGEFPFPAQDLQGQKNLWNAFTRMPREWVKQIRRVGGHDLTWLESPRSQPGQVFPSDRRVPSALRGKPIAGWVTQTPNGVPATDALENAGLSFQKVYEVKLPTGETVAYGHVVEAPALPPKPVTQPPALVSKRTTPPPAEAPAAARRPTYDLDLPEVRRQLWSKSSPFPENWVKDVESGGANLAARLHSPPGSPQVFPHEPYVPAELQGTPIDDVYVSVRHGLDVRRGELLTPEQVRGYADGFRIEKTLEPALPRVFEKSGWRVLRKHVAHLPDGREITYMIKSPGRHPLQVVGEVFKSSFAGDPAKMATEKRLEAIEAIISEISDPKTAPCYRIDNPQGCAESFRYLREHGIDPSRVGHAVRYDRRSRGLADLLADGADRVIRESGTRPGGKGGPLLLDDVKASLGQYGRGNRVYWERGMVRLYHMPDLSISNFTIEEAGQGVFYGHIFDY